MSGDFLNPVVKCTEMDVLKKYYDTLKKIQIELPVCYEGILNNLDEIVSNEYTYGVYIMFILTAGVIDDLKEAI
jgi:hypothetical protein